IACESRPAPRDEVPVAKTASATNTDSSQTGGIHDSGASQSTGGVSARGTTPTTAAAVVHAASTKGSTVHVVPVVATHSSATAQPAALANSGPPSATASLLATAAALIGLGIL